MKRGDTLLERRRQVIAAAERELVYVPPQRPASQQVSEFSQLSSNTSDFVKVQELADLRERQGKVPRRREVLTEDGKLLRKLQIETGIGRDGVARQPLEPWTCPVDGGMRLYHRIMHGGTVTLADVQGDDQVALKWMADEQLIAVADDGRVLPLSDARSKTVRAYPGAPVSDKRASVGGYLRDNGRGIVLAAIANICSGRTVRRCRKSRETLTADGIAVTAAKVCAEANRIKKLRADLDGYRYLSLSKCREIIRDLIGSRVLDEIASPKPVRRERSWHTLPRVIRRFAADTLDRLGRPVPPPLEAAA